MPVVSVPRGTPPPAGSGGRVLGPYPSAADAQAAGGAPAGPVAVPDTWYYCCRLPDGSVQIRPVSPADPAPCAGGVTVQGPFMTLAAAQAACQAGAPAVTPTPAGDGWECRQQPDGGRFVSLHST